MNADPAEPTDLPVSPVMPVVTVVRSDAQDLQGSEPSVGPAIGPPIEVVMLGGGGWRGAFGSIGAVAYLQAVGAWTQVRHVVALSGGSLVAGALGNADIDDERPSPALARLAGRVMDLKWPMRIAMVPPLIPIVAAAAAPLVLQGWWAVLWLLVPSSSLFAARWIVSFEWRWMMRRLFGSTAPRRGGARRYVVCATGRSSARPYFFVGGDTAGVVPPSPTPTPALRPSPRWGGVVDGTWTWTRAVVSSTALPWVHGYCATGPAGPAGPGGARAERLIDGGVVGIFGQQWFEEMLLGSAGGAMPRTLAVDTGRSHRMGGRCIERAIGFLTIGMLSRWVQIALDASFRKEIERASRAESATRPGDSPMMVLVRVAETDEGDRHADGARHDEVLRRLERGRTEVRRFGLAGLSRRNCLMTVVVAAVACAVDLETNCDVDTMRRRLRQVGRELELGDELAAIWDTL